MQLNLSARFGSFIAVTSFTAPLIDFSRVKSFTSSVARTSLSPETSTRVRHDYFSLSLLRLYKVERKTDAYELTVAASCYKPQNAFILCSFQIESIIIKWSSIQTNRSHFVHCSLNLHVPWLQIQVLDNRVKNNSNSKVQVPTMNWVRCESRLMAGSLQENNDH